MLVGWVAMCSFFFFLNRRKVYLQVNEGPPSKLEEGPEDTLIYINLTKGRSLGLQWERMEDSLWGFLMLREMGRGVYSGSQFSQKLPQREAEGSCLPCSPPPQGSSSKISFCIFSSSDVLTLGQRYSNLDGSPGLHVGPCF